MKKFQNPCGYGIDPQVTREEIIDYAEKLEEKVTRRNKQIKALKIKIKELTIRHQKFIKDLQKNTGKLNR